MIKINWCYNFLPDLKELANSIIVCEISFEILTNFPIRIKISVTQVGDGPYSKLIPSTINRRFNNQ